MAATGPPLVAQAGLRVEPVPVAPAHVAPAWCSPEPASRRAGTPPSSSRVTRDRALVLTRKGAGVALRVPRRAGGTRKEATVGVTAVVAVQEMARVPPKRGRPEGGGAAGPVVGRGRRAMARVAVATGRVGGRANTRVDRTLVRKTPLPATGQPARVQVQAPGAAEQDTAQTAAGAPAAAATSAGTAGYPTVVAPVTPAKAVMRPPEPGVPNGPAMGASLTATFPPVIVWRTPTATGRLGLTFIAPVAACPGPSLRPVGRRPAPTPPPAPGEAKAQTAGAQGVATTAGRPVIGPGTARHAPIKGWGRAARGPVFTAAPGTTPPP